MLQPIGLLRGLPVKQYRSMNVLRSIVKAGLVLSTGLYGCKQSVPVLCTAEYRSIVIRVSGDSLTDFYTVRLSTSDTIRRPNLDYKPQWYPVLDDSYHSTITNTQERYQFIGKIKNAIVVNEEYVIKADACHVYKVSGRDEVQL